MIKRFTSRGRSKSSPERSRRERHPRPRTSAGIRDAPSRRPMHHRRLRRGCIPRIPSHHLTVKKTPLKRGPKREKRQSLNHQDRAPEPVKKPAAKKRARIKPVSTKRAGWLREYEAEKKRRGNGPHKCIVCGAVITIGENASWHHRSGRRTLADLLDFVPVCEIPCHRDSIHGQPNEAMKMGWLSPRYRKTT